MLNFLGIGSAFSPELGNTSAYFIKEKDLYLIDCGGLVFKELINTVDFKKINQIHIFITHSHADHVGSLGTLISYISNRYGSKINIYHGGIKLLEYLDLIGINRDYYNLSELKEAEIDKVSFEFIETLHSERIKCFGIKIKLRDKTIYYSGDSSIIPEKVYSDFLNNKIDTLYQDVTLIEENKSHLSLNKLRELIPNNMRDKVVCMHLNGNSKDEIEKQGFRVAKKA